MGVRHIATAPRLNFSRSLLLACRIVENTTVPVDSDHKGNSKNESVSRHLHDAEVETLGGGKQN